MPLHVALAVLACALVAGCAAPTPSIDGTYACAADPATATPPPIDEVLPPLALEFLVPNVDGALDFYVERIGFTLISRDAAQRACFGVVDLQGAQILFDHREGERPDPGQSNIPRIMVDDVDAVYEQAKSNGVDIDLDIVDEDFGLRNFRIRDPFGFRLRFAQVI